MNEEQVKALSESVRFLTLKIQGLESRLSHKSTDESSVNHKRLYLEDFRGKRKKEGISQRTAIGTSSIYANIGKEQIKYFEDVLNSILDLTGLKMRSSDLLRAIIVDFMDKHTVESACDFVQSGKAKFMVR